MPDTTLLERTIQKAEWVLRRGIIVPYYIDEEHQSRLEAITPHEGFTGKKHPEDPFLRDRLIPFVLLSRHVGYAGLDQEGYSCLAKILEREYNAWLMDQASSNGYKALPPSLHIGLWIPSELNGSGPNCIFKSTSTDKRDVFFLTEEYVSRNS